MMANWESLTKDYERPPKRFDLVPSSRPQPFKKPDPAVNITPNVAGLRTDAQFDEHLVRSRNDTTVINFSSSWCDHCHKMFPAFMSLASSFPSLRFGVAQVDYMQEAPGDITYTPTFAVYKKGRKVDQFFGANAQQLRDHLWLQSEDD